MEILFKDSNFEGEYQIPSMKYDGAKHVHKSFVPVIPREDGDRPYSSDSMKM